jgi:hypothetical protein
VTSSWKMPTTHMPAVRGHQQAPFPTMLPATTGKSYNAKVIIDRECQHPHESCSNHKSCSTRSASNVVVMSTSLFMNPSIFWPMAHVWLAHVWP